MSTKVFENQMAGIFLLSKIGGKLSISELEKLIKKYINNWATCDTMSSEVAAKVLIESPERIEALYTWAKSKNIWLKRAALTTTVKLKDKIENWQEVACQILSLLEKEKEPTLKKAVHWLKKEVLR
jgi:3-methyladenine DNA glycosylase AlkD